MTRKIDDVMERDEAASQDTAELTCSTLGVDTSTYPSHISDLVSNRRQRRCSRSRATVPSASAPRSVLETVLIPASLSSLDHNTG